MNENKHLKIRCGGEVYIELNDLHFFQNKLKTIDKTNFDKLKKSIIQDGLPLGFHVWFDEKKQQWEIIDGHHRYLVLKDLESDNWFIPPIPCNKIIAKNRKEAAKIVLISNSRYAKINQESLAEFMIDFELQLPDLELLDFADIDLNQFEIDDKNENKNDVNGDVEFSYELEDKNNYIVLYFSNEESFKKAIDKFNIKQSKCILSTNQDNANMTSVGIGRLVNCDDLIDRIKIND